MNTLQKSTRRTPPGKALAVISVLLVLSGLLRALDGNLAFANAETPPAALAKDVPIAPPPVCKTSGDVEQMLVDLVSRQAQLDQRERRLNNRMQALNAAEKRLKVNTEKLISAEKKLSDTMAISNTAAEDDLARLTAVYENMKPKQATGLFEKMAPEFAAGFLGRMRAQTAAAVMATLSPAKAYKISVILAGRNARAPTN